MCFVDVGKVVEIVSNKLARLSDGRTVRLGGLKGVKTGDILEVYADLAVAKVKKSPKDRKDL